jgi:hypothetical protein
MEFGTEKRTFSPLELEQLPAERNVQQIEGGDQPKPL